MKFPNWHKPTLELPEMQHIRHYRLAVAGKDTAFAGCSCRGCVFFRASKSKHSMGLASNNGGSVLNDQKRTMLAPPFNMHVQSAERTFAEIAWPNAHVDPLIAGALNGWAGRFGWKA